jgi:hypothetical protein
MSRPDALAQRPISYDKESPAACADTLQATYLSRQTDKSHMSISSLDFPTRSDASGAYFYATAFYGKPKTKTAQNRSTQQDERSGAKCTLRLDLQACAIIPRSAEPNSSMYVRVAQWQAVSVDLS